MLYPRGTTYTPLEDKHTSPQVGVCKEPLDPCPLGAFTYFLRRWNCLTGHSSSNSCWFTSRGTRRNLLLETNSSMICRFIPRAWGREAGEEDGAVVREGWYCLLILILYFLQLPFWSKATEQVGPKTPTGRPQTLGFEYRTFQLGVTGLSLGGYLDDVGRLLRILLEQQHGGGVGVDVVPPQERGVVLLALVHVPEAHVVPEGERCQLQMEVE